METADLFSLLFIPFSRVDLGSGNTGLSRLLTEWMGRKADTRENRGHLETVLRLEERRLSAAGLRDGQQGVEQLIRRGIGLGYSMHVLPAVLAELGRKRGNAVERYCNEHRIFQDSFLQTFLPPSLTASWWQHFASARNAKERAAAVPDPSDQRGRQSFREHFSAHASTFMDLVRTDVVPSVLGAQDIPPRYLRNLAALRGLLAEQLGKRTAAQQTLQEALRLDRTYAMRTIDVLAYLPQDGRRGKSPVVGLIARVKSNDSMSRKIATRLVDIAKLVDHHQRNRLPPELFTLTFEETTLTDLYGIRVIARNQDAEGVLRFLAGQGFVEIDRVDNRAHTLSADAWQVQSKVYDRSRCLIYDVHITTMDDLAVLEFGKGSHDIRSIRRHQKHLSDKTYGKLYRLAYERALVFLEACNLPGIEPGMQEIARKSGEERLAQLEFRKDDALLRTFQLHIEERRELVHEPGEMERELHKKYITLSSKTGAQDWQRYRAEIKPQLESVLEQHLWAFTEALEVGTAVYDRHIPVLERYRLAAPVLKLRDDTLFLSTLYCALYPEEQFGIGRQRRQFEDGVAVLRQVGEMLYRINGCRDNIRGAFLEHDSKAVEEGITAAKRVGRERMKRDAVSWQVRQVFHEAQLEATALALEEYASLLRMPKPTDAAYRRAGEYLEEVTKRVEPSLRGMPGQIEKYQQAKTRLEKQLAKR